VGGPLIDVVTSSDFPGYKCGCVLDRAGAETEERSMLVRRVPPSLIAREQLHALLAWCDREVNIILALARRWAG
jgi:hypothetical protein